MKILRSLGETNLLSIIISVVGLAGAIVSLKTGLGTIGMVAALICLGIILVIGYQLFRPILVKNTRGVTLLEALTDVGLVDIENRNDKEHALPPPKFFRMAKFEITLSGISAYRTFDQNIKEVKQALKEGKKFFVLIMHPNSKEVQNISERENHDVRKDILTTIDAIKRENLLKYPGFKIKFLNRFPHFTAVMIDGDITCPHDVRPQDRNGQIRVQPTTIHKTQHQTQHLGVILQFRKKLREPLGAFDYFADAFRGQWNKEAFEDLEVFNQ